MLELSPQLFVYLKLHQRSSLLSTEKVYVLIIYFGFSSMHPINTKAFATRHACSDTTRVDDNIVLERVFQEN